jgi:hypothetical protein
MIEIKGFRNPKNLSQDYTKGSIEPKKHKNKD